MSRMSASALCAMMAWLACAGAALATPCDETAFRAEQGLVYLEAESALFVDKDQAAAAAALDRLEAMDLNCHEADVAEKFNHVGVARSIWSATARVPPCGRGQFNDPYY